MKEKINPIWEDKNNRKGGCWSFKIYKKNINKTWIDTTIHLLANSLTKSKDNSSMITGISISPKKSFCIIKIWNNNSKNNSKLLLNDKIENLSITECLYKAHNF